MNIRKSDLNNFVKDHNLKIPNKYGIKYFHTSWLKEPNFSKFYKPCLDKNPNDFIINAKAEKLFIKNRRVALVSSVFLIKKNIC